MKKADVKSIEDLEKYYSKVRKIKIKDVDVIAADRLWQAIILDRVATTFVRGGHQCEKYRDRSVDDFIKITKYYYPDYTIKQCFSIIRGGTSNKETCKFFGYCPNIRKDNFRGGAGWYSFSMSDFRNRTFIRQGFRNCKLTFNTFMENE